MRNKEGQNGNENLNESLRKYAVNKPWSRFFSYIAVSGKFDYRVL